MGIIRSHGSSRPGARRLAAVVATSALLATGAGAAHAMTPERGASPSARSGAAGAHGGASDVDRLLAGSYQSSLDRLSGGQTNDRIKNKTLPALTAPPTTGTAAKASPGTWKGEPTRFRYQWLLNGEAIPDATRSFYRPTTGGRLAVQVTASARGKEPATAVSRAQRITVLAISLVKAPTLKGLTTMGETLTAGRPKWSTANVVNTYVWYSGEKKIRGATEATYVLRRSDVGQQVHAVVTGTKEGYKSATTMTPWSGVITKR